MAQYYNTEDISGLTFFWLVFHVEHIDFSRVFKGKMFHVEHRNIATKLTKIQRKVRIYQLIMR